MTHDRLPFDDELVSAVLDGEATSEERALVEGSVEGRRRLAELRAVAEQVAAAPPALDPSRIDTLVGRALDAAGAGAPGPGADQLAERRARRSTGPGPWRRAVALAAAAVAAVALIGGVAALAGRSSSDEAADSSSESAVAGSADSGGAAAQESTSGAAADAAGEGPLDLGLLPDAAAVLAGYATLESDPSFSSRVAPPDVAPTSPATATDAACAVPPTAVLPGESWGLVASAELPSGPVVVMADTAAGPRGRVLVVDAATCAVLVERVR